MAKPSPLVPPAKGSIPVAFLLSKGAVVIDFCGPWEVFENVTIPGAKDDPFHLYTVAETINPIHASGGMKIIPDYTFDTAPAPKIIVIPAQNGANEAMLESIRQSLGPIAEREKARWLGPIGSLVVHLLPLLLLIEWPITAPPEIEPIAVQLVLAPPPPEQPQKPVPPPSPVPPKPEFKPPPPGRIASEDLGDTEAKKASREPSDAPAAKDIPPAEVRPSETPQQTADVDSRQPRQVRKEATVTGSCVCSGSPSVSFSLQVSSFPWNRSTTGHRSSLP